MCGIAGVAYARANKAKEYNIELMTKCLEHRGPDAGGTYKSADEQVQLGHRRLSILDLSEGSNQPFYSADRRYVMVYNGEVYNYLELRNKLPRYNWMTHSDTEVIMELFAAFGPACFEWLNGMFALAIHDTHNDTVTIARDQTGIKPLFYSYRKEEGLLSFASELKSLKKIAGKKINTQAVAYFLHLGYIPEPHTIYQEVGKFPSGHYAVYTPATGALDLTRFWNPEDHYLTNPIRNEAEALKQYREILFGAIERQMLSDVPLGTFLSGGIDSSLVSAVASNLRNTPISTFSIGFDEAKYDESVYAGEVAAHIKSNHHLFRVKLDDVLSLLPELLNVYDEPFADSSAFPTMLVSRLAREHVTVALSGDGGDELFQGYGMYAWAERLQKPALHALRKPIFAATRYMNERYQRAGHLFDYERRSGIPGHVFSQEQYLFGERELKRLLITGAPDFGTFNMLPQQGTAREKQAYWDLTHYLKDDLLVKVDRASMKYSLETRVPLLDQEIIKFALNVPLDLKLRDGYGTKYLMKKVLYDMVPRTIFERPKRGFAIPLEKWLYNELKDLVLKTLAPERIAAAGLVHPAQVAKLLNAFYGGKKYLYNRVWALLVLHQFYNNQ